MKNSNVRIMLEGAMMIALATVLSYIKLYDLPFGGSITLEMLPLVIMSLRNGTKWGLFTALVHGILQMMMGFSNVLYCETLFAQILCILLDYIIAFTALGSASLFTKVSSNKVVANTFGTAMAGAIRFVCSFLSGWILWGQWAPEGMSAVYYSLVYNGSYMLPNIVIACVVIALLTYKAPKLLESK
ncbi:MAG: energy-coupled thiamine transporter ThiT [Erysipelotrichaceae bacterium]|nr:energy-coupled thiamine transporter ThiT [Erysipelotrichaceae bacterium]